MVEMQSKGMSDSEKAMYNDILIGNTENFVNINGKLHWQDPDDASVDAIAISSIDAAGPVYANSVVMEKHIGLYNEVINAQFVDDRILHSKINNLWNMEGVGNAGLKSFIFDNEGASDILGFDTSDWFEDWFKDQGIDVNDEGAVLAEKERIRNAGVLASGKTGNVKQHFSAWYHGKLKSSVASQYNKTQAAKKKNSGLGDFDLEEEGNDLNDPKGKTSNISLYGQDNKQGAQVTFGIDSAWSQDEDQDTLSVLKREKLIPSGLSLETSNMFKEQIKVESDSNNIFAELPSHYSRFDTTTDQGKNHYRLMMSIYQMVDNKQYPKAIADEVELLKSGIGRFEAIFEHLTGEKLPKNDPAPGIAKGNYYDILDNYYS